ncbi:MAG: hypothetical protein KAU48_03145 [Candidatus Thorarchaeota archaeon]|nr:hypothetical protein [Candidatus Thorarchaeota archaeon]
MNGKTRGMSLVIVIALLIPILTMGLQNITEQPSIWIVYADNPDDSMNIAAQTFKNEMTSAGCIVRETTLNQLDNIPEHSDTIALIGHGHEDGVVVSDGIIAWTSLYEMIEKQNPLHTIVLACHSPSIPESKIFGFMGEIDAEAGALIASWHVSQVLDLKSFDVDLYDRAIEAQKALVHPLSRVVYFVHGYFGDPLDFDDMKEYLWFTSGLSGEYDEFLDFSYFDAYDVSTIIEKDGLHWCTSVSDYAMNFANYLIGEHDAGTQVNIVAHSLGGIITREMLALNRTHLEAAGIDIGTVVTLGTPHQGTYLADPTNLAATLLSLLPLFPNYNLWPSPVFYSVHPDHPLMFNLNFDPMRYSDGIRWYTGAGVDVFWGGFTIFIHSEFSDPIVAESRAKLAFAIESPTFVGLEHNALINYVDGTFSSVASWLSADSDSDGDGLKDSLEIYRYGTDPNDWDSDDDGLSDYNECIFHNTDPLNPDTDNDNLSDADEFTYGTSPLDDDSDDDGLLDGDEIFVYGTNPLAWSTDSDILSDAQEIAWGYDPNDTNDPISAQYLTYSAWQVSGITGKVRANHYTTMDYVKVYVNYKNSMGYWTGNMLVGTDYTPTYYGDYYVSWSLLSGYVQMLVTVQAFDSANHYLGSDYQYVTLPGSGGGGKPGGDPVPI